MRILVDIDCTIADTLRVWLDRIYEKTGVKAGVSDIVRWDISSCPPLDQLSRAEIMSIVDTPGFMVSVPPFKQALSALKTLHDNGHEIYLVTARTGPYAMPETKAWAERHLPWLSSEKNLCFVYDKALLSADVLIEDKAETIAAYRAVHPHTRILMVEYPHNEKDTTPGVFRFFRHSWDDACQYIISLENTND